MTLSTHNGTYAVPFATFSSEDRNGVMVYAHDSGQRYRWSYSPEMAVRSCDQWISDALTGKFPVECVGTVDRVPLSWISKEEDEYVG